MLKEELRSVKEQFYQELREDILRFWMDHAVDVENGGFYGYITNDLRVAKNAPKAGVLNARILWTYSTAYRVLKADEYLTMANRAYHYLADHFFDPEYSGIYWMLDYKGKALDSKKQIYAIAFAIYGLAEYFEATGDRESLKKAIELYKAIEEHSYDPENQGYLEALSRDWGPLADMSLSPKDLNVKKSMNTHLHILEAYTRLFRVWKDKELAGKLKEIIRITIDRILDPKKERFQLFFDEYWHSQSDIVSFGHDIEGSWLLYEAAEVLEDSAILSEVKPIALRMAENVLRNGIDTQNGGLYNEAKGGRLTDDGKDWWPQAEAVVGFCNAYQLSGEERFWKASLAMWEFIKSRIIDKQNGEWFWGVSRDGKVQLGREKVGPWKCPYHNSRMCFEMLQRLDGMISKS